MLLSTPNRRSSRKGVPPTEEGYVLLAVIFFLALLVISLAVAAPRIAKSIQRDHEVEAFHRGMQYRRAIQLYYRKYHAYPPTVDALVKTQEIRFLRKKYIDPITGKDDWKSIAYGQNKTPTAMGFFGQPLAGNPTSIAGIGPSGGNGLTASGSSGSTFGGSGSTFGGSSSLFGSSTSTTSSTAGASGTPGATGTSGSTSSTSGTDQSSSGASQTFGGAGIIGFSPGSSKQSILVYKKKNHYNEWEFTYDPISDTQTITGGNNGTTGLPTGNTPNGLGSPGPGNPASGSPGIGGSGGFSLSPTTPAPSPAPTTSQ